MSSDAQNMSSVEEDSVDDLNAFLRSMVGKNEKYVDQLMLVRTDNAFFSSTSLENSTSSANFPPQTPELSPRGERMPPQTPQTGWGADPKLPDFGSVDAEMRAMAAAMMGGESSSLSDNPMLGGGGLLGGADGGLLSAADISQMMLSTSCSSGGMGDVVEEDLLMAMAGEAKPSSDVVIDSGFRDYNALDAVFFSGFSGVVLHEDMKFKSTNREEMGQRVVVTLRAAEHGMALVLDSSKTMIFGALCEGRQAGTVKHLVHGLVDYLVDHDL